MAMDPQMQKNDKKMSINITAEVQNATEFFREGRMPVRKIDVEVF